MRLGQLSTGRAQTSVMTSTGPVSAVINSADCRTLIRRAARVKPTTGDSLRARVMLAATAGNSNAAIVDEGSKGGARSRHLQFLLVCAPRCREVCSHPQPRVSRDLTPSEAVSSELACGDRGVDLLAHAAAGAGGMTYTPCCSGLLRSHRNVWM